jgi:hypothetical protein
MSGIVDKVKAKVSGNKDNSDEQSFSIQPHPAVRSLPYLLIAEVESVLNL